MKLTIIENNHNKIYANLKKYPFFETNVLLKLLNFFRDKKIKNRYLLVRTSIIEKKGEKH